MEYRQLGTAGVRVSVIGVGGNTFGRYVDEAGTAAIVTAALEAGINFFDTADTYNQGTSEEYLGRAIRGRRDDVLVATKVGMRVGERPNETGASRKHVVESCERSLRRLGIEAIDLYQIHKFDPHTPQEETLSALDDLVRAGKVRYTGCSNYAAWQLTHALWVSDRRDLARFVSVQPEYNLLAREIEGELVPCCLAFGVGIIPFFPLAAGVLTGKYKPGEPPPPETRGSQSPGFDRRLRRETLETVQRLDAWARDHGHSAAELALAWLAAQHAVSTIIAGARRPEQVTANANAAEWKLTPEELAEIDRVLAESSGA